MPDQNARHEPPIAGHGAMNLPAVIVDSYNAELRDGEGFVGDRASNRAFRSILEDWRERLRAAGDDPFGDVPTEEISKSKLEKVLNSGDPEAAAIVEATVAEFAGELATVIRRFLRLDPWQGTERIVIGGGMMASRLGELAMGRASVLLKSEGIEIDLRPIRNHPDEAGLIGAVHLAPSWTMAGHDGILAVDIGGSNIRAGVIKLNVKKAPDLSKSRVWKSELWRHADDEPDREEAVERLAKMLSELVERAEDKLDLAPFIGIGCPGIIDEDGSITRGGQNLPGNWESPSFNLPARLRELIPTIRGQDTAILMHNDAVVQGLSEVFAMTDIEHWGVLTIGTGLGNARFTNRSDAAG